MKINDKQRRLLFAAGTVVAGIVAMIFLTVGDGVPASESTGIKQILVDHGHTATWVLLALALGSAAIRGKWAQPAKAFAVLAAASYVAFLAAVFVLP